MSGQNIIAATSIAPQVLVSQQLPANEAALYTVPAGTSVKVSTASLCNVSSLTLPPVLTLGTVAGSGGTFAAGTYYWKVTAKNATGETLGSNEITATVALNGTVSFSWTLVPGTVSYMIYRGTVAGAENVLVAAQVATAPTTYTDTGTIGTTAVPPAASTYAAAFTVYVSIVKNGGTLGDGTHRIVHAYNLAANDSFFFPANSLPGSMLGPGDAIAAYASASAMIDFVVTGTVQS